jgi:predicted phosphodiesterase
MKKYTKFVVVGDNHGHHVSETSVDAFESFLNHFKPELRIHDGDNWDFGAWRKGASIEEQNERNDEDLAAGADFIKLLRPNVMLLGNHDQRAFDQLESDNVDRQKSALHAVEKMHEVLRQVNCKKVFEYKVKGPRERDVNFFKYKNLITTHGMYAGNQSATRRIAQTVGHPGCVVVHGHTHDFNIITLEHISGPIVGISSMMMADVNQLGYSLKRMATTRWTNGWVYGVIDELTGNVKAFTAHKFGTGFIITEDFKVI